MLISKVGGIPAFLFSISMKWPGVAASGRRNEIEKNSLFGGREFSMRRKYVMIEILSGNRAVIGERTNFIWING